MRRSGDGLGGSPPDRRAARLRATSVVSAPSEVVLAPWSEPAALLTAAERDRAGRLRFGRDRSDFIAAHILARVTGGSVLGVDPRSLTLVQQCGHCGQAHGVPFFAEAPDVGVSMSHTRGYVAAVVGPGQVGVDTEQTRTGLATDGGLASEVLAPAELELVAAAPDRRHAFVRLWVRKEAMVKSGRGSLDDLSAVDFSTSPLVDLSTSPACIRRSHRQLLLEWQDPEWGVVGAAVTAHPPKLALLRRGQTTPELRDVPVVAAPHVARE